MAKFKINFKDANVQYVEKYYSGKYNTPVTIYFTEGDANTPRGYFCEGAVNVKTIENIDDLKKEIDKEMSKRDKKLDLTMVNDSKNKKVKDSYGEWDYEINCEGNQWADGGFDSEEEAEDEAIAKVNDLLARHFTADYAIDDFDIIIRNTDTGETYYYDPYTDIRDCGPECNKGFKDSKFKDASADEIIDLFHEAYIKGRTWDWLKHKLPEKFLNLYNLNNKGAYRRNYLFPIQADRTGKLEGVHLTKPKKLSSNYEEQIKELIDAIDEYISRASHIEYDFNLDFKDYNFTTIQYEVEKAIENTDSKSQSSDLSQALKYLKDTYNHIKKYTWEIPGLSSNIDLYIKAYDEGEDALYKYIANLIDKSYKADDYKENQKKPIIYNREGDYIRSDSKVGPLSKEAEDYIRRIMRTETTEDMERKTRERNERRNAEPHYWYGWGGSSKEKIGPYAQELYKLKELLSQLKSEAAKEEEMDISLRPKGKKYTYTGEGPLDYSGRYVGSKKGGYEYRGEMHPNKVSLNIKGLNPLEEALSKVLNSKTVDDIQTNLQEALEVVKTLPRNNPKVAELKEQIKELLDIRRNAPKIKRNLPDKKFKDFNYKKLKDGFTSEEYKEYKDLCKKLNLYTYADIVKFSKDHGNVQNKELLEALRKEANKK